MRVGNLKKSTFKFWIIVFVIWILIQGIFTFIILKDNTEDSIKKILDSNVEATVHYIQEQHKIAQGITYKLEEDKSISEYIKNNEKLKLEDTFKELKDTLVIVIDNNNEVVYKQNADDIAYYEFIEDESGIISEEDLLVCYINKKVYYEDKLVGTVMIGIRLNPKDIGEIVSIEINGEHIHYILNKYAFGTFAVSVVISLLIMYTINKKTIDRFVKINAKLNEIKLSNDIEVQSKEVKKENTVEAIVDSLENYYNIINYINKFDEVTKLYKKDYFLNELQEMLRGCDGSFLYLNIDGFSAINNSYGSQVGDEILSIVGERLKYNLTNDTYYISRLMGDEFGIFIKSDDNKTTLAKKCQRILNLINRPIILESRVHVITSTIGVSVYKEDAQSLGELLENSYLAMTTIKKQRKNSYRFYDNSLRNKVSLEMLQEGFENNEFTINYQPQLNSNKGKIIAVEALARWIHPEKGIISPIEFIPVAEETGYILTLGTWILNKACRDIRDINKRLGIDLKVAINISAIQFMQDNFEEIVEEALEKSGLSASCLELEITESVAMDSSQTMIEKINNLNKIGVTISLDDFGTGYSSLKYLHEFKINTLKIDKSFVDNMFNNNGIIRSIINIAHNLNATVVAEGVEVIEQVEELKRLKCDVLQGYYISKPLDKKKLEIFLTK